MIDFSFDFVCSRKTRGEEKRRKEDDDVVEGCGERDGRSISSDIRDWGTGHPGEGCWLGWAILGGLLLRSSASWSWLQDEQLESLDSSN